jgi:hypothetical protein
MLQPLAEDRIREGSVLDARPGSGARISKLPCASFHQSPRDASIVVQVLAWRTWFKTGGASLAMWSVPDVTENKPIIWIAREELEQRGSDPKPASQT